MSDDDYELSVGFSGVCVTDCVVQVEKTKGKHVKTGSIVAMGYLRVPA